jgi:hypothetical protein
MLMPDGQCEIKMDSIFDEAIMYIAVSKSATHDRYGGSFDFFYVFH